MALEPQVFMFDEPTAGMSVDEVPVDPRPDPRAQAATRRKTILLVEHKMDVVRELADRIIVLHNGTLVADGEPADGDRLADRAAAYLGRARRGGGRHERARCLRLQGVHTHIGAYHILHGVDLDGAARASVTMLLGRNGAGKTTTLRTIMGLWRASQGRSRSRFGGRRHRTALRARPTIAALGIAYVPENMGIFADLTVQENMLLAARAARRADAARHARLEWIFGLFPALKKFWLYPAGKLSGGQKQMLASRAPSSSRARCCSSTSRARAWRRRSSTT